MKKHIIHSIEVLILAVAVGGWLLSWVAKKDQREWVEYQINEMKSFNQEMLPLTISTNHLEPPRDFLNEYADYYFEFHNNGWVYTRVHSFHGDHYWESFGTEDDQSQYVGDISVAIDNEGNFYKSKGHVCGWFYDDFKQGHDFVGTNDFLVTIAPTNFMNDINHFLELWPWKRM